MRLHGLRDNKPIGPARSRVLQINVASPERNGATDEAETMDNKSTSSRAHINETPDLQR